jgi:hypothetical protein
VDAFSEILSGVKLNGAVFFSAEFSAPWGFQRRRRALSLTNSPQVRNTWCSIISLSMVGQSCS